MIILYPDRRERPHHNQEESTMTVNIESTHREMTGHSNFFREHRIASFFILTYAISWTALAVIVAGAGEAVSELAILVAQFGPAIAGTLMVYASVGSLREFAARLVKWRVPVKWYLVMLGLPAALTLISSLWLLYLDFPVDYSLIVEQLPMYLLSLLMITLIAGLGEEPGWRGFALPHLQQRFSPVKATAILGVLWATWHLPPYLVDQEFQGLTLGGPAVMVGVVLLTLLMIASLAFFYTWIYNHTGSVLVMMLLHGSMTTARVIFMPLTFEASHDASYPLLLLSITGTIVAAVVVLINATKGRLGYGSEA
jgi:membrane protease YdiL (CAAX protease family)